MAQQGWAIHAGSAFGSEDEVYVPEINRTGFSTPASMFSQHGSARTAPTFALGYLISMGIVLLGTKSDRASEKNEEKPDQEMWN